MTLAAHGNMWYVFSAGATMPGWPRMPPKMARLAPRTRAVAGGRISVAPSMPRQIILVDGRWVRGAFDRRRDFGARLHGSAARHAPQPELRAACLGQGRRAGLGRTWTRSDRRKNGTCIGWRDPLTEVLAGRDEEALDLISTCLRRLAIPHESRLSGRHRPGRPPRPRRQSHTFARSRGDDVGKHGAADGRAPARRRPRDQRSPLACPSAPIPGASRRLPPPAGRVTRLKGPLDPATWALAA